MTKYAFLFFCLACVCVRAQEPALVSVPEPPLPSLEGKEAAVGPMLEGKELLAPAKPESQRVVQDLPSAEKVAISLPKASGNDIAQFYRQLTGKRVLVDAGAAGIEANIIVFGDGESTEDAVKAFNKALLLNGLAIVPSGENEVKLINTATGGKNAKIEGVPVVDEEIDIPEGDNVITYVMPLRYIMPEEASRTFNSVVGTLHPYGSITAVPNASALIITENASLIRTFVDLKNKIDVPTQQIASKWVDVKYADVESLAQTLEKITKPESATNATARRVVNNPGQVTIIRESAPAGQGPMVQGGSSDAPAQIIPDTRTNRLLLMGRPMDLVFLETLISQFDIPTDTRNSLRRKLCYLTVLDFMPVAQNALDRMNPEPSQNGQPNQSNRQNNLNSQNNRNNNNNSRNNNTASAVGSGSDMLTAPDSSGAPDSVIVGRTLLVADTITNSIVVQGPPQSIEVINQLLDQIDVKGPQVMISTIFGQFRSTDNREFGVDWVAALRKSGNFSYGGTDFTTGAGWNPTDSNLPTDKLAGNLSGLSFYGKFAGNINFLLRAAMDTGKFSVLSRPTVFTVNNQKAVIASGQKVAVPTSQLTDATGSGLATNTSINYMNIVLKLEVIPLVNSEKEVTLQVGQLNDQIIGYQKIGGADAAEVPTISTQQIITTVTVPNGGTVILGGLITRDESEQKYGIPLISDIPLVGSLFSTKVKKMEEREIVIFIQPTIVNDNKEGYESQLRERSRYQGMPQAMQFAEPTVLSNEEHEGLLPVVAPSEVMTEYTPSASSSASSYTQKPTPATTAPAPAKKTPRFRGAGRQFGAF